MLKCPGCPCLFLSESDLKTHLKVFKGLIPHEKAFSKLHVNVERGNDPETTVAEDDDGWIKSKFGDGALIKHVSKDPKLALSIQQNGTITMGGYCHSLNGNRQWIIRHPHQNR